MTNNNGSNKMFHATHSIVLNDGWHYVSCKSHEDVIYPKRTEDGKVKMNDGIHFTFSVLREHRNINRLYCLVDVSKDRSEKDRNQYVRIVSSLIGTTEEYAGKMTVASKSLEKKHCHILTRANPATGLAEILDFAPCK